MYLGDLAPSSHVAPSVPGCRASVPHSARPAGARHKPTSAWHPSCQDASLPTSQAIAEASGVKHWGTPGNHVIKHVRLMDIALLLQHCRQVAHALPGCIVFWAMLCQGRLQLTACGASMGGFFLPVSNAASSCLPMSSSNATKALLQQRVSLCSSPSSLRRPFRAFRKRGSAS